MGYGESSRRAPDKIITMGDGDVEIRHIPRVEIVHEELERLWAYIDGYPKEIAGIGRVECIGDATYRITQVFLVEQWGNEAAHVDISEGTARFIEQEATADRPVAPYRFWWHSHVKFAAHWSGTDEDTAKNLDMDFLIALVGNKRREFRLRFDLFRPVRLVFDNLPLHVVTAPIAGVTAAAQRDIAALVHSGREQKERWVAPPVFPDRQPWGQPRDQAAVPHVYVPPQSVETAATVAARTEVPPPTLTESVPQAAASPVATNMGPIIAIEENRLADKILSKTAPAPEGPKQPLKPTDDTPLAPTAPRTADDQRPHRGGSAPPAMKGTAAPPAASEAHRSLANEAPSPPPRRQGMVAQFPFDLTKGVTYLDRPNTSAQ